MSALLLFGLSNLSGCAARQQEIMHAVSDKPRHLAVGIRATTGSRYALLRAAEGLLFESSILKPGIAPGGSQSCYFAHGNDPEVAVSAITMSSRASIAEILGVLRAVEERLTEPGASRPSVSVELWWVEGVHLDTKDLTLPNPEIFSKRSVNMTFVSGIENALVYALQHGTISRFEARRIARAFKRFDNGESLPQERMYEGLDWFEIDPRDDGRTRYRTYALDDADAVAVAGRLAEFAAMHTQIGEDFYQETMDFRKSQRVHYLQIEMAADSSLESNARAWASASLALANEQHIALVNTVVFRMTDTRISGAVLGEVAEAVPLRVDGSERIGIRRARINERYPDPFELEMLSVQPEVPAASSVSPPAP